MKVDFRNVQYCKATNLYLGFQYGRIARFSSNKELKEYEIDHRFKQNLTNKSFTLIELICVISIISILFTMLIPSIDKVRGLSKRSVCISNQRQLGLAIAGFINDSNDYFPSTGTHTSIGGDNITWDDKLGYGYDGRSLSIADAQLDSLEDDSSTLNISSVYRCPEINYGSHKNWRSYLVVRGIDSNRGQYSGPFDYVSGPKGLSSISSSMCSTPSQSISLACNIQYYKPMGYAYSHTIDPTFMLKSHGGGPALTGKGVSNYLMIDGHIESLHGDETKKVNTPLWDNLSTRWHYQFSGW